MSASKLLFAANRVRLKGDGASPFELWTLAEDASKDAQERARLFHHAMIHAGYVVDSDTTRPYPTCPQCAETLGTR